MLRWLQHNHQALTAVGAMLVGVAALFVAWDQARVMRAQQHGAVYPVVQVDGFVSNTPTTAAMGIRVANNGVGPALIRSVQVNYLGEPRQDLDPYRAVLPSGYELSWAGLTGRALAPGETVEPIRFSWSREDVSGAQMRAAADEWDNWTLTICYCSVFDRCWLSSALGGAAAEPVAQCEATGEDVFEQLGQGPVVPDETSLQSADSSPEDEQ